MFERPQRLAVLVASVGSIAVAGVGCAAKQRIALDCLPKEVTVYVDGERLPDMPTALDLRRDRPHTLYFKGPDFEPELVVIEVAEADGEVRLAPDKVCVTPRYREVRRELEIAIDPDVSAGPSDSDAENRSAIDVEPRPDFVPAGP